MLAPASIGAAWRDFRRETSVSLAKAPRQTAEPVAPGKVGPERELWYRPPGSWTMRGAEAALVELERCEFRDAGRLADALLADDKISSSLWNRCGAVTGLEFGFDPEPAGIREDWDWMFPVEHQDQVLAQCHLMGFCLVQDVRTSYDELPRWEPWPADSTRYDIFRRQWQVWTVDHGLLDINPGDGQWALFRSRLVRPWLAALMRAAAPLMIIRQSTRFNGANHAQVYATPSRVLTTEKRMSQLEDVEVAISRLRRIVGDSTIVLPEGLKMELLELRGKSGHEIYKWLIEHCDDCTDLLFMGQKGTAKAAGGWGSAHTERRVTQDLLERDARMMTDTTHRQILAPYDAWKRGTRDLRRVPRWVLNTVPPADLESESKRDALEAQADMQRAQAMVAMSQLRLKGRGGRMVQVNMEQWAQERKIPVVEYVESEVEPAPALPPHQEQEAA